jgi:hypothetical protein
MIGKARWPSGWRGGVLVVLGVLLGATVLQPAVAHVSDSVRHLTREHLDPRYVNTGEAAGGDLSGRHGNLQIRANAVTGAEVDEGSLGQVPSAAAADNATNADDATNAGNVTDADFVDVNSIEKFHVNRNGSINTDLVTMFTVGGLTLKANCVEDIGDNLNVYVRTDTNNSYFRSSVGNSDTDFDTADGDMLVFSADTSDQNGTMVYRQGSSSGLNAGVVAVTFGYATNPTIGRDCQLAGVAVGH